MAGRAYYGGGLAVLGGIAELGDSRVDNNLARYGGGGFYVKQTNPTDSLKLQRVALRTNLAYTAVSAMAIERSVLVEGVLVNVSAPCLPHPGAVRANVAIDVHEGAAALRGLHVSTQPGCPVEPTVTGSIVQCGSTYQDGGRTVSPCGQGATCSSSIVTDSVSMPTCACARPAYPIVGKDTELAPYIDGCTYPLQVKSLKHSSPEVFVELVKGSYSRADAIVVNLTLTVNGTAWQASGASRLLAPWHVAQIQATWLRPLLSMGSLEPPFLLGGESVTMIPVKISSRGLASSADVPYTSSLVVTVLSNQTVSIPVRATVLAYPVASNCALAANTSSVLHAIVNESASFTFVARDIDGLPVHASPVSSAISFSAKVDRCTDVSCKHTQHFASALPPVIERLVGGSYRVRLSIRHLGMYRVSVYYQHRIQTEVLEALPWQITVIGICALPGHPHSSNCPPLLPVRSPPRL